MRSVDIDWSPFADAVSRHQRFLVTSHVRPDGDALGSEIGMAGLLRQLGKDVRILNVSPTPPRYAFLDPDSTLFEHFDPDHPDPDHASRDALVILDLSSWSQLAGMAPFVRDFPGQKLVIDHHVSQDDLGALVFKDTTAEATGTLVLRAFRALNKKPDTRAATGLLTAIAMDTGWFRHPSTTASTFRDVADLLDQGAPLSLVYRLLFEQNSLPRMRLIGSVLSRLHLENDGRLAYATVTRDDFTHTGAIPPDTEDIIDQLASIKGVEVALLFIEQLRGGIKLSLRSRAGFDCSSLASSFGGGGHRAAAGANLPDPLSTQLPLVLSRVAESMRVPSL